jgi:hypothetical protein
MLPAYPLLQVAARIEAAQGEGFLRALKAEWEAHNKSVQMIRDILMYMDRIYVKQQVGAACCTCCAVLCMGCRAWCSGDIRSRMEPHLCLASDG